MTTDVDEMTAAATARKQAGALVFKAGPDVGGKQAVALTPVGNERATPNRIPDVPEVFLTQEAVLDIAMDLRVQAATLIAVAEGLEKHAGRSTNTPVPSPLEQQKEAERLADERHDERVWVEAAKAVVTQGGEQLADRMARLAREAQAHVYGDAPSGSADPDWTCSVHGASAINVLTSRRGRTYRACKSCGEFEK